MSDSQNLAVPASMQLCRCNVNCLPQSIERVVIRAHVHTQSTGPSESVGVKLMPTIALSLSKVTRTAAASLGYTSIKPEQESAIVSFLRDNDVFVSLPMGYGKSLCYAALSYAFDQLRASSHPSIVIVVSPLIALMKDQVASYSTKGLKVGSITSESLSEDRSQAVRSNFQLLLFSPESLLIGHRWRELLQMEPYRSNVVAFIFDVAHCVKKW